MNTKVQEIAKTTGVTTADTLKKQEQAVAQQPAPEVTTQAIAPAQPQEGIDQAKALTQAVDAFIFGSKTLKRLSKEQVAVCKQTALAFNLNPIKKEIHFVPRGDDVTAVVGYEVYIKRADATGKLRGWSCVTEGTGESMKAVLKIKRSDWEMEFVHEVYMSEARVNNSGVWQKMPRFMLKKTAIGQGFRLCFPQEVGGLPYLAEELGIGVIEGGKLQEDKQFTSPEPMGINSKQIERIKALLVIKGKDLARILDYYKVKRLEEMTYREAAGTIAKLQTLPDQQPDNIDLDEVDRGIEAQRLEGNS